MAVHWQCFAIVAQIRMCYNVYAQNCIKCRQGKTDTIFSMVFFCCPDRRNRTSRLHFSGRLNIFSRRYTVKNQLKTTKPKDRKDRRHINWGRFLFAGFLSVTMLAANTMPAFAATTVWEKANEIMKDVYTQILTISTIAAVVTAAIALLMMNFSKSGRTVDEARAWLKRIIITWAILNGLGFIMAYITPFFSGGKWNG
jgi:hypothetical protein